MGDQKLRFYLDEQMPVVIAKELRRRKIEATTVKELQLRGRSDESHLARAAAGGWVLCAMDDDYVELAKTGMQHTGIVVGVRKDRKAIGTWVRFLIWMHDTYSQDDMMNRVEYLRLV